MANFCPKDAFVTVTYFSRAEACALPGRKDTAVLSITDPNEGFAPLKRGWAHVLRLQFHDIRKPYPDHQEFNSNLAELVVQWICAAAQKDNIDHIMVHCYAGISRSAAVAKFIAEVFGLYFDPTYSAHNPLVYELLWDAYQKRNF